MGQFLFHCTIQSSQHQCYPSGSYKFEVPNNGLQRFVYLLALNLAHFSRVLESQYSSKVKHGAEGVFSVVLVSLCSLSYR